MTRYAEGTQVPADRSRSEIERVLLRYGATEFAYGYDQRQAVIMFTIEGLRVRIALPLPERSSTEFTRTPTGKVRVQSAAEAAWEQATRQSWRALALVVKAKLEAVESGITTLVDEFAVHIVLPGGRSVGDLVVPAIAQAYEEGSPGPLLDVVSGRKELGR